MPSRTEFHRETGELLQRLFRILLAEPRIRRRDVLDRFRTHAPLTDAEVSRIDFGTVGASTVGWFSKEPRNCWSVTTAGENALRRWPDPEQFHRELDRLYKALTSPV